ncbi:MAG TPA: serine/threonine protein kinase, partial [Pseudomonadota bacterium]|nr:serine/threonine protein kinase [Pseudomonadota bacterium]
MSLAPGTILGHYRIARMIGSGGMGAVYDAVQLGIERHVAIKILHAKLLIRPDAVRRFLSEARAVNLVDHPSV